MPDAVSLLYNIPGLKYSNGSDEVPRLRLSRRSLVNIFLGNINMWNDSSIVDDNPGVDLPNDIISLIVRDDIAGPSNGMFTLFIFEILDINHVCSVEWCPWQVLS